MDKEKIKEIILRLLEGNLTKEDATKILLDLGEHFIKDLDDTWDQCKKYKADDLKSVEVISMLEETRCPKDLLARKYATVYYMYRLLRDKANSPKNIITLPDRPQVDSNN